MTWDRNLRLIEASATSQGLKVRRFTTHVHPFKGVSYVVETAPLDDLFNATEHVVRLDENDTVVWS
jgi:hypothetical protein